MAMNRLTFQLEKTATGSRARATRFRTLHNEVLTPTFMPVGTHAAVRAQRREDLIEANAQVLLANTYHLLLRPGTEIFKQFGGIHKFMNWPRSVLTDSGGFQIFCLPNSRVMKEDGAYFKSYVDHSTICLSPELSISTQKAIGSDIMMVLDQCVPSTVDRSIATEAMHLTHRWALRSLEARGSSPQALFGIVQGACYEDLRVESAKVITDMPFDGYAIGGLAVGESQSEREDCTAVVTDQLPKDKPRYLMGVGTTLDLLEAIHRGVDMFDCILPTSMAQQGKAFTSLGRRDLRRAFYRDKDEPLDPACQCYTCKTYSLAYLSHIHRVHESQAWQLIGLHNVHFYMDLMKLCREHILADTWLSFYNSQRPLLDARDSYGPKTAHFSNIERKKKRLELGRFEVLLGEPFSRIRDMTSGEVMHSVNDPDVEAETVYISQSDLRGKLLSKREEPIVIWDVGLGAATNAMAAIRAAEESLKDKSCENTSSRKLVIYSFEHDLDALKLVCRFPSRFKHIRHPAPHSLLDNGSWTSSCGQIEWNLLAGDFKQRFSETPPAHIIYFDPFSFKQDSDMWTVDVFRKILEHSNARSHLHEVELFTYSASTAVRAGLLLAGFYVAKGAATGPKSETTIAVSPSRTQSEHCFTWLDFQWLDKWRRSDAKKPHGLLDGSIGWEDAIHNHAQFKSQD
jgi:queuine tRNA-ribosyltransferase